ncbi:unnamed protein product [Schistosoma turkestanicum]|nr:unnamed protein product [Schistosoma turkestanicum]
MKFLCPACKLPTNPCSILNDLHKYHNENCQCRINANTTGNINICAVHHDYFDGKSCCITGNHQNSSDLYTMKIVTPTLNQPSCMFNVCPLDLSNDINYTHLPLSTQTVNSGNSRSTTNDFLPTSSINSIHYEYHASPQSDPKFRSDLTPNIVEENIYTTNNLCNLSYIHASQSINSSSTGRVCDAGNEISDYSKEITTKSNLIHGFLKRDRKFDYDNMNDHQFYNKIINNNGNILTDNCPYELKSINLRTQDQTEKGVIRSPSSNFYDRTDYQQRINNNKTNNNFTDTDNCVESLENYDKYTENNPGDETTNSPLKSTLECKMKSFNQIHLNPQKYASMTLTNDNTYNDSYLIRKSSCKQQSCYRQETNQQIDEINPQYRNFKSNDFNAIIQKYNSLGNASVESLAVPLIDPPQNFRTPNNEPHLNEIDNNALSNKITTTPTHKPPDVILKSGNYHDEVDLERPPPKMPPLRGILTNRTAMNEKNTAF